MKQILLVAVLAFAAPACKTDQVATPAEQAEMVVLVEAGDVEGAEALERSIAERAVGGFIEIIDPLIPFPMKVFTGLIAAALFPRVRRTTLSSVKKVADTTIKLIKGDWKNAGTAIGEAVNDTLSIVGLVDSRNATSDDMQAWADDVRASDPTLADAIEAKILLMSTATA